MGKIQRQVTVVRDGMHNAFTDLACWQGAYWVSYRKGTAHASIDGQACVSISVDRTRFREAARLKVLGDNRDPKLFPIDDKRMALIFPSWLGGYAKRDLQSFIAFTEDGFNWSEPQPVLARQQWLWRIREHAGRYYALIQNLAGGWDTGRPPHALDLAVSDDFLTWKTLARIGGDLGLNESDIHWRPDGEAWVIARTVQETETCASYFACAREPYTDWQVTPLQPMIHAPVMLQHKENLYVAGRRKATQENDTNFPFLSPQSLGIWRVTRGAVTPVMRIPATGDCSYPGLIEDPEGRVCLSYYSQHAYHMGVVPMPFRLEPTPPHDHGQLLASDDVYFAELDLP